MANSVTPTRGPYQAQPIIRDRCACGAEPTHRVADTRKPHGERYPRRAQCFACAHRRAQEMNEDWKGCQPKEDSDGE